MVRPGFALLTGAAAVIGAAIDRGRDRKPDGAAIAREQREAARALFVPLHHVRLARALAAIDGMAWRDQDTRHQRIAADLEAAARTFVAAIDSATVERRPVILDLAAESVERIGAALAEVNDEDRRLDEGDAQTLARYLQSRCGEGSR